MSVPVTIFMWAIATVGVTLIAAWLVHPAVILGTMIGVAMTTLKNMHIGD